MTTGQKTTKQSTKLDTKEIAIVNAARQTFLIRGFDGASMDLIAETANVSKRTVYNRFRSKESLFAASILDLCQQLLPINIEEVENSLSPKDLLRHFSESFLRGILMPDAIALKRIAAFESSRTPALGQAYLENGPNRMVQTCVPIMNRLAKRENIILDDPEMAIWQLGALITEPIYTQCVMGQPPEDLEGAILHQLDSGITAFSKIYGI